jgi:hypothetical protein
MSRMHALLPHVAASIWMLSAWAAVQAADAPAAGDVATSRLLDALEEQQMPDVVLLVLERVESDRAAGEALKKEVPFRRAKALVAISRLDSDAAKRAANYDRAQKEIEAFLAAGPAVEDAIPAYMQKGNLLVERGRGKIEQSRRPGADAAPLLAEAVEFFDGALKVLEGKPRKPDEEITEVTNAEDAVLKVLRDINAELKKAGGGGADAKNDPESKPKPVKKKSSKADARRIDELEERQKALRGQLLQVRLLVAGVYFEKSRALPPQSKEWTEALTTSAKKYGELYNKYGHLGAGMFARFYEGRNYAELGDKKKAIDTLAELCVLQGQAGFVPGLRAKAINTTLQCWLNDEEEETFSGFTDDFLKAAVAQVPADQLDADWLGMKYRSALVLEKRAAGLGDKEKTKQATYRRDAKKIALEVAKANRDFAKEARELLALLGKDVAGDAAGAASFEALMDDAKVALATMQAEQAKVKKAQASGAADEAAAAMAAAAEARDKTIDAVTKAIPLATDEDVAAVNQARYMLTFLFFDAKRLHEAATMGAFLADRYPNSKGSRQAATIAMASWQQLQKQGSAEWSLDAKAKCGQLAELIMRTWPADAESADAALVAIAAAIEARKPDQVVAIIEQVPAQSPRRGEVLLRAGAALTREIQEIRRMDESVRPPAEAVAAWRKKAVAALDDGLASVPAGTAPSKVSVAAALARAQVAMEAGDLELVGKILDSKEYGPWAVLQGDDKQFTEGPLAEGALSLALRYFIGADKLENADEAMNRLEALAGAGDEASAKLTGMYLAMGRDLQGQLEALSTGDKAGTPEAQAQADRILGGFEKFLERVGKRDEKISSQMWVASTFLTLGSGEGTGRVVSKEKAGAYLTKAAEVYEKLLAKGGDEIAKFEAAIRLKMANIYRERGKWDEALVHFDWILGDPSRQNLLDVQIQAAQLLQAAGEKSDDESRAAEFLKQAIAGRKQGTSVMWGWGGLSNKLSRQAFAGNDERALKAQAQFFDARFNVARCRLERAEVSGQDRDKLLEMAFNDVAITYKLYPGLGGEVMKKRFEKLLRQIQQARNMPAEGLAAIDEANAAAAQAGQ